MHRVSTAPVPRSQCQSSCPSFADWRCLRRLGSGRWTEVFEAAPISQLHQSADYVLKALRPELQDDPIARSTLQRQAYLGQQISDPHLESVLAAHVTSPPFYVVSPLMQGSTLLATLKFAGKLPAAQSLWLVRQCAQGLQTLHQHAWLHGDIKPANVFVSASGHATLIDFGLARPIGQKAEAGSACLVGTPAYAPPEAGCNSIAAAAYSDVYSLGVTLFEMLTGRLPFTAMSARDLSKAHAEQTPPEPRSFVPWLPRRVSWLVARMLAKQPLRRPDLDELIDWLIDLELDVIDERLATE